MSAKTGKVIAVESAGMVSGPQSRSSMGPWGQVEYERVVIEPPAECVPAALTKPERRPWFFKDYSSLRLKEFFEETHPGAELVKVLLTTNTWRVAPEGIWVSPEPRTVLSIPPDVRARIYSELAKFNENGGQRHPFFWAAADEKELFKTSAVSAATLATIQGLSYRRGDLVLLSDLGVLLESVADSSERVRIVQTLSRQFGVLLRLNLNRQTDADLVLRYWGSGGMGKTLRPVLEAACRTQEGRKIPAIGLLPLPMRSRIYTFPSTRPAADLDGLWTAANFFEENPTMNPVGPLEWIQKCKTDYYPLDSDPRYGDVLMLTRADGRLLHSSVYLADDIVFTKNAAGSLNPWMLMRVTDLCNHFKVELPEGEQLRMTYIRQKKV